MTLIRADLHIVTEHFSPTGDGWTVIRVRVIDKQIVSYWQSRAAADAEAARLNHNPTPTQED
jgi:hypothetical protein